jgi:ABC-type glycerol-3-phosphate transport system substrate-binding protein
MLRKRICILLTVVLVFLSFSWCSNSPKGDLFRNASERAASNVAQVPDLKGQTIKIVSNGAKLVPTGGTELGDLKVKWFEEVQKKYNCKFDIQKGDFTTADKLVVATMANDYYCDFIWEGSKVLYDLAKQGIIQPWDEYINTKSPKILTSTFNSYLGATQLNGKTYELNIDNSSMPTDIIYFNKTLFKKYGIPMPYDMVKNNTWNWDNFRKIAKQATIDTNSDGEPDIWGISNAGFIDRTLGYFYANKTSITKLDANNKISVNITDSAYVETLEFLRTMAQVDKSMQPYDKTPAWDQGGKDFKASKVAMTPYMNKSMVIKDGFTEEFGVVPFPMGPRATNYTGGLSEICGYSIAGKIDNAKEKATVVFDWLANNPYVTEEMHDKLYYGSIAQYVYDTDSVDMFKIINRSDMLLDFSRFISNAPGYWGSNFDVISAKKTPTQVVEEQKDLLQAELDKLYAPE